MPRRRLFYKGKELEEMDTQAILNLHPEIVVVDELAHTNIEGSGNPKRWQDVMQLLDAGISVITAVNIQHIEGLNESRAGDHRDRGPRARAGQRAGHGRRGGEHRPHGRRADRAAESGENLPPRQGRGGAQQLLHGRTISCSCANWHSRRWPCAWRKRSRTRSPRATSSCHDKLLAVIDSSEKRSRRVIRKTARMATHLNTSFVVLYVQSDREAADRIPLANQRYLINNLNLATELGGEIRQIHSNRPVETIVELCREQKISIVCTGRPEFSLFSLLKSIVALRRLIGRLSRMNIDLYIMS